MGSELLRRGSRITHKFAIQMIYFSHMNGKWNMEWAWQVKHGVSMASETWSEHGKWNMEWAWQVKHGVSMASETWEWAWQVKHGVSMASETWSEHGKWNMEWAWQVKHGMSMASETWSDHGKWNMEWAWQVILNSVVETGCTVCVVVYCWIAVHNEENYW